MHFRGGGSGHKVTCEWDEFLQHEECKPPPSNEDLRSNDLQPEDIESEDKIQPDGQIGEDPNNSDSNSLEPNGSDNLEEEGENILIADEEEELDETVWAKEGYDETTSNIQRL